MVQKVQEIDQAQKSRSLDRYMETAHSDQHDFHHAEKRIRFFMGGNRSGKTTSGAVETLWCLLGRHPFKRLKLPLKGAVVVQDFENHAKNILEPKLLQWAPTGAIVNADRNQNGAWRKVHFLGGSMLDVLSHDQDIKVFEGGDYDFVWFDEPPPKKIFTALWRGLTDRGGFAFITATPLTTPWLYAEIKKAEAGDDLRWFRYVDTTKNAKNIGEGDEILGLKRIKEFADLLDPEEKEARLHGRFVHMLGLIFKTWKPQHHLIPEFEWPTSWPIIESIDPHPHKPWGVSWIGIAENGAKILLRSGLFQGVIDEIADQIIYERAHIRIAGNNKPKIARCLIDNYASVALWQKSQTEPTARRLSVREELENMIGVRMGGCRVEVAPKNVKGKIDLFKQWLHIKDNGKSEFYAFDIPENERFIYEIENYIWDTKRGGVHQGLKDQPLKRDDDILDSILQVALTYREQMHIRKEPVKARINKSWKV
jgi:phage terminase large subunit-like protein